MNLDKIYEAREKLRDVVQLTSLEKSYNLSTEFKADVWLKREDQQIVRSYKIRGAYNKISSAALSEINNPKVVCASAGNHAQGVALSCALLNIPGVIFMPETTPNQKVAKVKQFGGELIEIVLTGDTFDDAFFASQEFTRNNNCLFIHPFDDDEVIAGQGTIGLEILDQLNKKIDYLFLPIGGGGLAAGVCQVMKTLSPETKIIGAEPGGAPAMKESILAGKRVTLEKIDKFVDGAAVKTVGAKNFDICRDLLDDVVLVSEGEVCSRILSLYNDGIIVEPAGSLAVAAMRQYQDHIQNKTVVCILSGSNNDIARIEEIRERALLFEGKKFYFLIRFPQRPGALKDFVTKVLAPDDDITYFQFSKKNNKESGPAVIGLELYSTRAYNNVIENLKALKFEFEELNKNTSWLDQFI